MNRKIVLFLVLLLSLLLITFVTSVVMERKSNIEVFLNLIYVNIESGSWPSTNPNDFFQVASWHPYIFKEKPTKQNWVDPNKAIYEVMKKHGDGDKRVVFSEMGYTDNDLSRDKIAEYLSEVFRLAKNNFPWLDTIYWYRLTDRDLIYEGWGFSKMDGFGVVESPETWTWKPAAYAYQSLTHFEPIDQYDPGLFGMHETLAYRSLYENLNISRAFEIMHSLGVRKIRMQFWRDSFMLNSAEINPSARGAVEEVIRKASPLGMEIMGYAEDFPSWMTDINGDVRAVPRRDTTGYGVFLEKYEESWETLAKEFPEIKVWEIGNEYNLDQFLHPQGDSNKKETAFTDQEKADITTDLLYYGSRGIKAGNPNATTVMCGLGPGGNGIYESAEWLTMVVISGIVGAIIAAGIVTVYFVRKTRKQPFRNEDTCYDVGRTRTTLKSFAVNEF